MRFIQCLVFVASLFLVSACGGANRQDDSGVQDIQPGDQSIIQPPSTRSAAPAGQVEERNI